MDTSYYSLFSLDPDETIEVRVGDLQEFLRQQMMGATNPGLTVTTQAERQSLLSLEERETFLTVRWMRDDIVDAIERASGIRLDRNGTHATEVEATIDKVVDAVQKQLEDSAIADGWDVIATLMPEEALTEATFIAQERVLYPVKQPVRDWYMSHYPTDDLGERIKPDTTFGDALEAVAFGSAFYEAIGVDDSLVRERVFQKLSDIYDVDYKDIYESWLNMEPVFDWSYSLPFDTGLAAIRRVGAQKFESIMAFDMAGDHGAPGNQWALVHDRIDLGDVPDAFIADLLHSKGYDDYKAYVNDFDDPTLALAEDIAVKRYNDGITEYIPYGDAQSAFDAMARTVKDLDVDAALAAQSGSRRLQESAETVVVLSGERPSLQHEASVMRQAADSLNCDSAGQKKETIRR